MCDCAVFILMVIFALVIIDAGFSWYLATFDEKQFREFATWRYPHRSESNYENLRRSLRTGFPIACLVFLIMLILTECVGLHW